MTRPSRPSSPRWSVLLRIGVGVFAFGVFIVLFSYGQSSLGFVVLAVGAACLFAALVTYFRAAAQERERLRGGRPPSRRTP